MSTKDSKPEQPCTIHSVKGSFSTCQIMRRKLIKKGTINMSTGEKSEMKEEWVTEKCGTPLFSYDDKINGECKICKKGWTHENNYRV